MDEIDRIKFFGFRKEKERKFHIPFVKLRMYRQCACQKRYLFPSRASVFSTLYRSCLCSRESIYSINMTQMCLPSLKTHTHTHTHTHAKLWRDARNYHFTGTALDNLVNVFHTLGNAEPLIYIYLM